MRTTEYWKTYVQETDVRDIMRSMQRSTFRSRGLVLNLCSFEKDTHAPSVLIIPATGCHSLMYAEVCYQLHCLGYNVFCFDFQGHGDSEGRRGDFTINDLVQNSNDAIKHITAHFNDRIGVYGFSLGGLVAFYCALSNQGSKSLVCQNPGMLAEKEFREALLLRWSGRMLIPFLPLMLKVIPWMKIPITLYLDWDAITSADEKGALRTYLNDPDTLKWYTVRAAATQLLTPAPLPPEELDIPVRFIVPNKDALMPAAYVTSLFARLSRNNKDLVVTEGGHMDVLVHPTRTARTMHEWFSRTV